MPEADDRIALHPAPPGAPDSGEGDLGADKVREKHD
jgi:hypothetical protein